jgi:phosphate-selective porin OprO and OprP
MIRRLSPLGHLPVVCLAALSCAFAAAPVRAQQPATAAPAQKEEPASGFVWDDRPSVRFKDGSHIDLKARVQTDYLFHSGAETEDLTFADRLSVRRKRVGIEGELFNRIEFQVDGAIGASQPWRDVYADFRVNRALQIRGGRFKVPFSFEQLISSANIDFLERAAAVSDLSPSRDIGVMVHGRLANRALKYEVGLFENDAAARLWTSGSPRTVAGRITIAPLIDGKTRGSEALEISAAVVRSNLPEGRSGLTDQLVLGEEVFRAMFVNGSRTRIGASVAFRSRRADVTGELIRSMDTRRGQAIDDGDLSDLIYTGGYISGMWHVVPGRGRRRGPSPVRALDIGARFDRLTFGSGNQDDEAFLNPRADHVATIGKNTWTLGVNWHLNYWMKVQANTIREQLVDPLSLLPLSAAPIWSTILRFQVAM